MALQYPGMREELLQALALLAEPYVPDPEYRANRPAGGSLFLDIFMLVCDELDLERYPDGAIGYFLNDEGEARALAPPCVFPESGLR